MWNIKRTINARKIKGYDNVYVSDDAIIKPKALHEINKYNNSLVKRYGIKVAPDILIVSNDNLNYNVLGIYSAILNVTIYPFDVVKKTQRHEMWHCKQADGYRQSGMIIDEITYKEYVKKICSSAKTKLEKIGINEDNVLDISKYAKEMYEIGRFDEVEAEYEALKGDKNGF